MLIGTLAAAVGSYVFQIVGVRALGEDAFAPVAVVWTLVFLGITVFLIPVEQLIIRRLTLAGGRTDSLRGSWRVIGLAIAGSTALAVLFSVVALDGQLAGDAGFVPVAALMYPTHAVLLIARGFLAGHGRFVAYGVAVTLDAVGKAGGAIVVGVLGWGPVALAWALIVSPVLVLLLRPFRPGPAADDVSDLILPRSDRRFMTGYVVATAASQTVLAAGPLVVGALGASGAAVSVFFVTTTLFRGPMSASYNLLARILPGLTVRAAAGDHESVNRLVRITAAAGLVSSVVVGFAAAALGPAVVAFLYGPGSRPSTALAGLAAAGVIAGIVGLGTTQVLVGRGATDRMAAVWLVAVAAAAITIVVASGEPGVRVAAGFFVGEVVALLGLTLAAVVRPGASDLVPAP
jgi:O-antigen/teichoic acid export membrane protein